MATFGKTWWGHKWLDAFKGIDDKNRLPRGKIYANDGKVYEVTIVKKLIKANVTGSRPRPYSVKISLSCFSDLEKNRIAEIIESSPSIISSLINKKIPESLSDKLIEEKLFLFPKDWNEISAQCSCPDWAVPCKHIAAVIYLIANEIDRNPFILFEIRGCDLLSLISDFKDGKLESIKNIPRVDDLLKSDIYQKKDLEEVNVLLEEMDFSKIPNLLEQILLLLVDDPPFYKEDFKLYLSYAYLHWQRNSKKNIKDFSTRLKDEKRQESSSNVDGYDKEQEFFETYGNPRAWEFVRIYLDKNYRVEKISNDINELFPGDNKKFLYLINFLNEMPVSILSNVDLTLRFLYTCNLFALRLLESSAIVPQILCLEADRYLVRWIPAEFDAEVNRILQHLYGLCSKDIVYSHTISDLISKSEQVRIILSFFISSYITDNIPVAFKKNKLDPVISLFFRDFIFETDGFIKKEIPSAINQWLSNLYLSKREYKLYLGIEDDNQKFTIRLQISTAEEKLPIDLKYFLKNTSLEVRLSIFSDISILSKYIPQIENWIDQDFEVIYTLKKFAPLFLDILPILKVMGIDTILPKSLKNVFLPKVSISINLSNSSNKKQKGLHLSEILDFDWGISVGKNKIGIEEFKKLSKESNKLVRLVDGYMIMDDAKIQNILKKMELPQKKLSKNELLQAMLAGKFDESYIESNSYIEDCLKKIRDVKSIDTPKNLNATLRPYQERGFQWMITNIQNNFGCILADDMGLGKTLQTITVLLHLKNIGELNASAKALIVVPTGLIINWQRELQRFAPDIKIYIFHGKEKTIPEKCDIVLTTYGTVRSEVKKIQKNEWFLFIIDEAQNIKNSFTEQSKAIKSISSKYKIALSGTPVENRLSEYWSIFDFVNKGYLGSLKDFQNNFSNPIERSRCKETLENFKKITSPFIMRRLKSDKSVISDLPEKIERNVYCTLTPEQASIYQEVVELYTEEMAKESPLGQHKKHRFALILKMLTALKQICNHPANYTKSREVKIDESGKLQTLIEIVDEILMNSDEKIIVFTQFTEMGEILSRVLKDIFAIDIPFLYGGLDLKSRDKMILDFQNSLQKRILLISLKAGGTGLNLVEANHVIHYDLWWNPAVENQATDRAYRIGQRKNVIVHRLISIGTLEEQIDQIISNKRDLANLTVSSGENWITEMTNEELKEVIRLR